MTETPEAVRHQPPAQAAIADAALVEPQGAQGLVQDQRAGGDDVRALGLQAGQGAALGQRQRAEPVDELLELRRP